MPETAGQFLVWRSASLSRSPGAARGDDLPLEGIDWPLNFPLPNRCEVCGEPRLLFRRGGPEFGGNWHCDRFCVCPLCGWHYVDHTEPEVYHDNAELSVLKDCTVNDGDVALAEVGSHLRRRRQDLYALSPRRFEQLVEDVFKQLGFRTILTATTRDRGADVVLLHDGTAQRVGIVECKRYAATRSVGVHLVRHLVGACVDWQVSKAYLVTSTSFSSEARSKALDFRRRGFEIELVAMAELVALLGIYNCALPPLASLTADQRAQIAESCRAQLIKRYRAFEPLSFREQVERRAYDLYLRHGCQPGFELDDWTRAEQEILREDGREGWFRMG